MSSYDIHFQLLSTDELEEQSQQALGKAYTFGFTSAVGVRGPQKLINRWVKCLLTTKGSDPLNKKYGTGLTGLIGSNITDRKDVTDAVTLFIDDCNQQIRVIDQKTAPPDDERLHSAVLDSVVSTADGVQVYIRVRNSAGTIVPVKLPTLSVR